MSLQKGKQPPSQLLQSIPQQRGPQPYFSDYEPLNPGSRPASGLVTIPAAEEYIQRPYQPQPNPALRPNIHPSLSANSSNPHDMSKQPLPSQPGMPGASAPQPAGPQLVFAGQQVPHPQSFYRPTPSRQQVQSVPQRGPMNVPMNPGAPQHQQQYYPAQMTANMIPLTPHMTMPQTMYVQSNVPPVPTYRQQYPQQPPYQIPPQQAVYLQGGTPQFSYGGQSSHNATVFYPPPLMTRPQTVSTIGTTPPVLMKKERKLIRIQDPATERDITEELVGGGTTNNSTSPMLVPPSTRETPPLNPTPPRTSEIASQFATQVALAAAKNSSEDHSHANPRTATPSDKPPDDREPKISIAKLDGSSDNKILEKPQSESILPQLTDTSKHVGLVSHSLPLTNSGVPVLVSVPADKQTLLVKDIKVDVPELTRAVFTATVPVSEPAIVEAMPPEVAIVDVIPSPPPEVNDNDDALPADVVPEESTPEEEINVELVVVEEKMEVEMHHVEEISPDESVSPGSPPIKVDASSIAAEVWLEENVPRENGELPLHEPVDHPIEKWEPEAKDTKKQKNKRKQLLNRKGESKEGGEMDAFIDRDEQLPPTVAAMAPELSASVEDISSKEEQRKVAEKNEENTKVSREYEKSDEDTPVIEQPIPKSQPVLKYNYKEDQWSPLNPEGKRQYDRAFLIHMQSQPMCLKKPEGLPDLEVIKDTVNRLKLFEPRPPGISTGISRNIGQVPDFTPGYVKSSTPRGQINGTSTPLMLFQAQVRGGGSGDGRGGESRGESRGSDGRGGRPSQQGKIEARRQDGKKSFTLSINHEVKLNKSENAWRPTHKHGGVDAELAKTEDLYKKVRGILNKLTPQKFQMLVEQVNNLTINTEERLKGVIDLVFEKAIDEPSFSVAYANLCKCLALMKVPVGNKENDYVNFRKLLLNKCQKEFERDITDEVDKKQRLKDIDAAETEEKKKELEEDYLDMERKAKRRSLGNIRFIGELFKLNMLTANIMHDCLKKLLTQEDEDSLECLCRLLTTIGRDMDTDKTKPGSKPEDNKMNGYFKQMREIVNKRQTSSRVRFMLQDVMELRMSKWVPRRDENAPKTIDQIHQEAQMEAMEREYQLQQPPASHRRPDDRDKRGKRSNAANQGSVGEDGWNTVGSKNSGRIDPKLKLSKVIVDDIQLGPGGQNFKGWSRGSSGGSRTSSQEPENKTSSPANRFQALASDQSAAASDSRRGTARTPTPCGRDSSKGRGTQMPPSSQRSSKSVAPSRAEREQAIAAVKNLASGEAGRIHVAESRESSMNREESSRDSAEPLLRGRPDLRIDEIEKRTKPLLDEFLHNCDIQEASTCVSELCAPSTIHIFVTAALNSVLERSAQARCHIGQLMHDLVKKKYMSIDQYIEGLQGLLSVAEDYVIDIPHFWDYMGELIAPLVQDGTLPLCSLQEAAKPIEGSIAGSFVSAVLHALAKNLGTHKVGELWKSSGLTWADFLNSNESQQKFIEDHRLEFTVNTVEHKADKELSLEEIKIEMKSILKGKNDDNEHIFDWIHANVGEARSQEPAFVRALITAVCQSAIDETAMKIDEKILRNRSKVLLKYLDHKEELELQALFALQALMHHLEHPKGVLHEMFNLLFDEDVISEDAFFLWEKNDDPGEQEGKGVALNSVRAFFTWLKEMDNESVEES